MYVKIPADSSAPLEELTASKAGGLENDELVLQAKAYFQHQANADHPSCEITALSIPLPGNNYRAVSLYGSDYPEVGAAAAENARASKLVTACGHAIAEPIRGDVFVGRAHDNEAFAWERDNFTSTDADATAEWCRVARSSGGGGGHGGKAASSLSNLVQQQLGAAQGKAPPQIVAPPSSNTGMYGMDGASPVSESWGSWTQSSDEVELKLSVPSATKAKDCKITFKRNQLVVAVPGSDGGSTVEPKIEGDLFGAVVPDDCTYTLENVSGDTRELCVTLTKADEGATWSWLTASK